MHGKDRIRKTSGIELKRRESTLGLLQSCGTIGGLRLKTSESARSLLCEGPFVYALQGMLEFTHLNDPIRRFRFRRQVNRGRLLKQKRGRVAPGQIRKVRCEATIDTAGARKSKGVGQAARVHGPASRYKAPRGERHPRFRLVWERKDRKRGNLSQISFRSRPVPRTVD